MAAEDRKLHIVVFPYLAFGHMIPFLNLSKLIAQKGHTVSFVSTPRNLDRLPKPPPILSNHLKFVGIPLPRHENLPENAEATGDIPHAQVKYLQSSIDALQQPMSEFLRQNTPDWVFYDFVHHWVPAVTSELNIRCAYFSVFTAASLAFSGPVEALKGVKDGRKTPEDWTVKPKWVPFETTVCFKIYEILKLADGLSEDDGNLAYTFRLGCCLEGCDVIAVRSCLEFEPEWLKLLEDLHPKPVVPVGQLPTIQDSDDHHTTDNENENDAAWGYFKRWLDMQEKGSVVYVAFGGEAKPSQAELTEIALGLELSGLPFFWALRMARGDRDDQTLELPSGFEERIRDRAVICTSWVPQLKILSHESVGGFLTHCGWSSVVEAVQFEKAMILLPLFADQGVISRLLEEKKMGYPIPRDESDGSFTREAVARSLRLVVAEEAGKIYRDRVKEMKGFFSDEGRQDLYVEHLLGFLQTYKR